MPPISWQSPLSSRQAVLQLILPLPPPGADASGRHIPYQCVLGVAAKPLVRKTDRTGAKDCDKSREVAQPALGALNLRGARLDSCARLGRAGRPPPSPDTPGRSALEA